MCLKTGKDVQVQPLTLRINMLQAELELWVKNFLKKANGTEMFKFSLLPFEYLCYRQNLSWDREENTEKEENKRKRKDFIVFY
jgi:hypothetical protein